MRRASGRSAALPLACVAALVLGLAGARAAGQAPQAPAPPAAAQGDGQQLTFAELMREGYEIRTTTFVPAEAVTRQSGKASSDAVVVTLQKAAATAVCFYTLKAYVGRKLSTIPACIVHR